jgi:uncharacterized membrane protein (DUF373 family)
VQLGFRASAITASPGATVIRPVLSRTMTVVGPDPVRPAAINEFVVAAFTAKLRGYRTDAGPVVGRWIMRLHWFESAMDAANKLLHVFMALALLVVSVLLIWQFVADVLQTFRSGQVAHGFLQALGNLFILWVLSSLISAEVRYMRSGYFSVLVFIEAALITLLRQLIIIPVESAGHLESAAWTYGLITAAVVAVGLTDYLVRRTPASGSNHGSME